MRDEKKTNHLTQLIDRSAVQPFLKLGLDFEQPFVKIKMG
jgi:hypothetical protein